MNSEAHVYRKCIVIKLQGTISLQAIIGICSRVGDATKAQYVVTAKNGN
jgi:hypothetical protein